MLTASASASSKLAWEQPVMTVTAASKDIRGGAADLDEDWIGSPF